MTDWLPFLCVGVLIHLAHALYRAHARMERMEKEFTRRLRELESIQGALAHAVAQMQRDRDATLWVDRDGIVHRGNE